jgi:hypothetical protein
MVFFKKPRISKEQAIQIAKEVASQEKWPWLEPIGVKSGLTQWRLVTNTKNRGRNIRVYINKQTGVVAYKGFAPR